MYQGPNENELRTITAYFETIPPCRRHTRILPDIYETLHVGGREIVEKRAQGTVNITGRPTAVDGVIAAFLRRDPFFNVKFREVTPTLIEKAHRALEKGPTDKVYPGITRENMEAAAVYLRAHGAVEEELRSKRGNYHWKKLQKAADRLGIRFPDLFPDHADPDEEEDEYLDAEAEEVDELLGGV